MQTSFSTNVSFQMVLKTLKSIERRTKLAKIGENELKPIIIRNDRHAYLVLVQNRGLTIFHTLHLLQIARRDHYAGTWLAQMRSSQTLTYTHAHTYTHAQKASYDDLFWILFFIRQCDVKNVCRVLTFFHLHCRWLHTVSIVNSHEIHEFSYFGSFLWNSGKL